MASRKHITWPSWHPLQEVVSGASRDSTISFLPNNQFDVLFRFYCRHSELSDGFCLPSTITTHHEISLGSERNALVFMIDRLDYVKN